MKFHLRRGNGAYFFAAPDPVAFAASAKARQTLPNTRSSFKDKDGNLPFACFSLIIAATFSFDFANSVPDCYDVLVESLRLVSGCPYVILLFLHNDNRLAMIFYTLGCLERTVPDCSFRFFSLALSRWLPRAMMTATWCA